MRHITEYKLFEDEKSVISYDFDGVCHISVVGLHPTDFIDSDKWVPFTEMHEQMREDAKTHRIIVVTSRPPATDEYVWEFIKKYDLPVEQVYATDNEPKTPLLKGLNVVKHYDDNIELREPLKQAGIEFVFVDPIKRTQKLMEELNQTNPMKNYTITFTNDKFFISDNTLASFINRLKKIDPELKHDPKLNGSGKNHRLVYIKSSVITHEQIRNLIKQFVENYDYLTMSVVGTKSF
jgi:hypothetical protein